MIRLRRQRSVPPIHGNFHGPKRAELALELLENQRRIRRSEIDKHPFRSTVWKQAKDQLLVESNDKYAYCEAPTAAVAFGDVEHYRPKSVYWWLAYSLENYLASCALCNRKFKRDKFPIDGPKWKAPRVARNTSNEKLRQLASTAVPDPLDQATVNRYESDHAAERPYLVNPYIVDPEPIFAWQPDDILEEVELVPNQATADANKFVRLAELVYGLNRLQLKKLRYTTYESYRIHRLTASAPGVPANVRNENATMVRRMMEDGRPFAGMIRYFEAFGGPPPRVR